jgi:hypothetical protein
VGRIYGAEHVIYAEKKLREQVAAEIAKRGEITE